MDTPAKENKSFLQEEVSKCGIFYLLSVLWISLVTIYANLTNQMGLFYWVVIGLCALFLCAVLTDKNKKIEIWLLYFSVIFICGGFTVAIFIETKLMADWVALARTHLNI